MEKVFIIILNWNGWQDTIACLESVLRSTYPHFRVIVCDNASTDNSLERIAAWAEGRLQAICPTPSLERLISPPLSKPIPFIHADLSRQGEVLSHGEPLILLQTGANRGFAAGVNMGLRLALRSDPDYVWILNNDTLVESSTLEELVRRMREKPQAGICGATVLYLDEPEVIQALGGSVFNPWLARGRQMKSGASLSEMEIDAEEIESRLSYIVGASMLVRRRLLEEVGLMSEQFFLYFEEIDWALRAARSRFQLAYAPGSVVYHKVGASTGKNLSKSQSNPAVEFYSSRNRILITRQFFPYATIPAGLAVIVKALYRLLHRDTQSCKAQLRGLMRGLFSNRKRGLANL